jgi:deoxyadenosine/deoxycytidine kinase
MEHKYLVIEGNIGAGKTSLASRLAADYNARLILEEFAENPFLAKFYQEPERYAFPVELSFLSARFSQLKNELSQQNLFQPLTIADYFIGKCQVFAKNNLATDEYQLFLKMYDIVAESVKKPDLIVYLYLDIDQLKANIRKRGRSFEQEIQAEYLEDIQQRYLEFIRQHEDLSVLIVDTGQLNFVEREADYQILKQMVTKQYPKGITRIQPTA